MKNFLVILLVIIPGGVYAQEKPEGAYYLQGVMEVASGFLIKPDSSFQFIFSYGALDREGSGRWSISGNNILLNSSPKPANSFSLTESKEIDQNFTVVKIKGSNKPFLRYVHAVLQCADTTIEEVTNEEGVIRILKTGIDHLILSFEFSPEKVDRFNLDKSNNYFEFKMEPSITEVLFENFKLQFGPNGLKGKHPLLKDGEYRYVKEN